MKAKEAYEQVMKGHQISHLSWLENKGNSEIFMSMGQSISQKIPGGTYIDWFLSFPLPSIADNKLVHSDNDGWVVTAIASRKTRFIFFFKRLKTLFN